MERKYIYEEMENNYKCVMLGSVHHHSYHTVVDTYDQLTSIDKYSIRRNADM